MGYDGDNNGSKLGSGAAGLVSTQRTPGFSGDVPPYSSFTPDASDTVLQATEPYDPTHSWQGGVGFRQGALPIIILATDVGTGYQDDGLTSIVGANGVTVPIADLTSISRSYSPYPDTGARFQQTISALNSLNALVIGLGTNSEDVYAPRRTLEALAKLTGAVNRSTASVPSGISGDPIATGDPFYFQINPFDTQNPTNVADGIRTAITSGLTDPAVNVRLRITDPTVSFVSNPTLRSGVGPGEQASFTVTFTGNGSPHNFDLQFVNDATNVLLGSIPVTINYNYSYDVNAIDPDNDPVTFDLLEGPTWATMPNHTTGIIQGTPTSNGTYHFKIKASDGRGGEDIQEFDLVVAKGDPNTPPRITSDAQRNATATLPYVYDVDATDDDGDRLTYLLSSAPATMAIDPASGRITWTPTVADIGTRNVGVMVQDGRGGTDLQNVSIVVQAATAANHEPEFVSEAPLTAIAGESYLYRARARRGFGRADLRHRLGSDRHGNRSRHGRCCLDAA